MESSARPFCAKLVPVHCLSRLIPGEAWHPLDGGPAPEYVPPAWDGPHVGLRLSDAFKTLTALPARLNNGSGAFWPEYVHDWQDLMAQEESDVQAKDDKRSERNRTRFRPTAQQISRMELAIMWAGNYVPCPENARIVQRVAFYRSHELDIEAISRRLRMGLRMLKAINRGALDRIASGLRRDRVQVF